MSDKFTKEIKVKLEQLDDDIVTLAAHTKEIENRYEADQIQKEQTLVARQRQEQLEFEKEQLELKAKYQNDHGATKVTKTQVKLPKLVLTKFNGKLENWLSFWNTFEVEVDSADLPAVTKFSYLKEMIEPKVRLAIDGLPLTSEGYERSKNILKSTYGKTSEIINAYVESIQKLPVIFGSNPAKIYNFYRTLQFNVQSLETLGKQQNAGQW